MGQSLVRLNFLDHILNNSEFLTVCATFLKSPCYVNLWHFFMHCSGFNGCEWFLIFLNKFLFSGPYIYRTKVSELKWISKWETWPYQFLGKIVTHFPHFGLLILPLIWRFLYIPPTLIYYKTPSCTRSPLLLVDYTFSWKNKLKHTGMDRYRY